MNKYYVSPDGSDSNNGCSKEEAFETVAAAFSALGDRAGKVVLLPGTHKIFSTINLKNGQSIGSIDKT